MGKKSLMRLGYTLTLGILSLAVVACGDKNTDDGGSTGVKFPTSFYVGSVGENYATINILEIDKGASLRNLPVQVLPEGSSSHVNHSITFGNSSTKSEALKANHAIGSLWFSFAEGKVVEEDLKLNVEVAHYKIDANLNVVAVSDWVPFNKIIVNDKDGNKISAATIDDAPVKNVEIGSAGSRGDFSLPAASGLLFIQFLDADGNTVTPSNPDIYVDNSNEEVFKTRLVMDANKYILEVAPNAIEKTAVITLKTVENDRAVAVLNLKSKARSPQITPAQESGLYIPDNFDAEELLAKFNVANLPEGMKVKGVLSGTNDILRFKEIGGDEATIADGVATFTLVKGSVTRTVGNTVTLTATLVDESQNDVLNNDDTFISASITIKVVDVIVDKVGDTVLSGFCQGFNEFALSAVMDFPRDAVDSEILDMISSTATGGSTSGATDIDDITVTKVVVDTKAGDVVDPETADLEGKAVLTCVGNLPVGVPTFINGVTTINGVDVTATEGSITAPLPVLSLHTNSTLVSNRNESTIIYIESTHYNASLYDILVAEKPGGDPDDLLPAPGETGGIVVVELVRDEGASVSYTLGGSGTGTTVTIVATVVPEGETDTTNAIGTPLELELRMTYN